MVGGGIAGLAAATALTERGVAVTLIEREDQLGGRVRAWPIDGGDGRTMSRGFHAFFRQYYNLRRLLQRSDPGLRRLGPISDYPLRHAEGHRDSFRRVARTPPWNLASFVATSPSFQLRDLARVDLDAAFGLLDVDFPATFDEYDQISASDYLDRLRFPQRARHLALEVFARSFFADPGDFSAGELVGMFHSYFVGSAEGLLFDVPVDDYDTTLWAPLGDHLRTGGATVRTGATVTGLDLSGRQVALTLADNTALTADAVVLAADLHGLGSLLHADVPGVDPDWQQRVRALPVAPPFVVWRLWLDRPVAADRPAFMGTSGYGPLDNITVVNHYEAGAAEWARRTTGSVVELHAYAVAADRSGGAGLAALQQELLAGLHTVHPETAHARVLADEFRWDRDCPAFPPGQRATRPGVDTPDARVVLAGDGVACDLPVALMERAATTGVQAANALLERWGVHGHDLWTVPRRARSRWPGRARGLLAHLPRRRSRLRRSA